MSDAIDQEIRQGQVSARRYQSAIKVLFFGQSGSGQSVNAPRDMHFKPLPARKANDDRWCAGLPEPDLVFAPLCRIYRLHDRGTFNGYYEGVLWTKYIL
jgi:hypothetical protein